MARTPRDRARAAMRTERSEPWYRISNTAGTGTAEVYIYDEIGYWGVTAQDFANELRDLDVDHIDLHLNSPGGDVFDGIAITNALRSHKAKVVVTVDGLAASAASFIAMAGDEVVMARNSELMIHDASGICFGNAADMTRLAADLDRVSDNIASIYAERAGGTTEDWRAVMRDEQWYSAQEAVDAGLADRVAVKADGEQAKARLDLSVFNYAGRAHAPAPITPRASASGTPAATAAEGSALVELTDEQVTTLTDKLGIASDADAQTLVDAVVEALDEQGEESGTENSASTEPATTAQLPDGVVAIDRAQLEELRNSAARGLQAAERQEAADREALVANAVADGRIAPASRQRWLTALANDPDAGTNLAALEPGLIPVTNAIGHTGESKAEITPDAVRESDAYQNWK